MNKLGVEAEVIVVRDLLKNDVQQINHIQKIKEIVELENVVIPVGNILPREILFGRRRGKVIAEQIQVMQRHKSERS